VSLHAVQAVAAPCANTSVKGLAPVLSEVDAKGSIVRLTSPRPFATDNGAETMTYPEGNITLRDARLFDPAQLA
jgi:hypothetical protein